MKTDRLVFYVLAFLALATTIPSYFLYRVLATEKDYLLEKDVDELADTSISPHLEATVDKNKNLIWCASFQLAWNEACDRFGVPIRLEDEPAMVPVLNGRKVTKRHVHDEAFLAVAGTTDEGVREKIIAGVEKKFAGCVRPRLLPASTASPEELVVYAVLYRRLSFPVPFEDLAEPVFFGGKAVRNFGANSALEPEYETMYSQVRVHDYRTADDFVLELKTDSDTDQFVLAKLPEPGATLVETVELAVKRLNDDPAPMRSSDVLRIPRIDFDLVKRFGELVGKRVLLGNVETDIRVFEAVQSVRFSLDEKGLELKSEAQVSFGCGARGPGKWRLVFDKPFLLFLRKAGTDLPYFAVWVGHPEILVPKR